MSNLTAPGAPFEIHEGTALGRPMRLFRNAPDNLLAFFEQSRRHSAASFIVDGDRSLNYADAFRRVDALAAWLQAHYPDIRGQRVAISMQNRAEWMLAFVSAVMVGAVPVLVNSRLSGAEMRAAVEKLDVTLAFADTRRTKALQEAGWAAPLLDLESAWPADAFDGKKASTDFAPHADDDAAILFTSGTTGEVKGVVLTHRALVTGIMSVQLSGAMILHKMAERYNMAPEQLVASTPQSCNLLVAPLFHVSGLSLFLSSMVSGGKLVVMQRWDPAAALELVGREKITAFSGVPTMLWDVLNRAEIAGADISTLTSVSTGGQALPLNLIASITNACPKALLGSGYGLTETSGAVAMAVGDDFVGRPGSAGRLLDLAEMRVIDSHGKELPAGSVGEIVVRGPMVMRDYWSGGGVDAEGWFATGDIGRVDEEGFVYLIDRKKDMIISGGENIYCAEIERVIGLLPEVLEVATFGVPDERLGERLVAQIVIAPEVSLGPEYVSDHVAQQLGAYKAPSEVRFQNDPLPRTDSGKINKLILRAQWPQEEGVA